MFDCSNFLVPFESFNEELAYIFYLFDCNDFWDFEIISYFWLLVGALTYYVLVAYVVTFGIFVGSYFPGLFGCCDLGDTKFLCAKSNTFDVL